MKRSGAGAISGAAFAIFRRLRETGHETYAVNSKGGEVDGICLHRDLTSIPTPDGVVVVTPAPAALGVVEECARLVRHKAGMATSKLRQWKHQPGGYRLLSFGGHLGDPRCLPHDVLRASGLLAQMHPLDIAADW